MASSTINKMSSFKDIVDCNLKILLESLKFELDFFFKEYKILDYFGQRSVPLL